jgi:hypothetical protein
MPPVRDGRRPSRALPAAAANRPPAPSERPRGLFGRLFPGDSARAERLRAGASPTSAAREIPLTPETPADAAFKKRVVKEVRDRLGSRVSSFDVQVSGRDVQIRAKVPRFWQRRAARNDLLAMPVLTGYKVSVDLAD